MPNIKKKDKFALHVKVKRNRAVFYHEQLPEGEKEKEDDEEEKDDDDDDDEEEEEEKELEKKIFCNIQFINPTSRFATDCCEKTYTLSERDLEFYMTDFNYDRSLSNCNAYFDITWKFLQKCRVLLTTLEEDELNELNNGKMYFTNDILACF